MFQKRMHFFCIVCFLCVSLTFLVHHKYASEAVPKILDLFTKPRFLNSSVVKGTPYILQDKGTTKISYISQDKGIHDTKKNPYLFHDILGHDKGTDDRVSLIVWYNFPHPKKFTPSAFFQTCPDIRCRLSVNKTLLESADAVLVHAPSLTEPPIPQGSPNQVWVFKSMESPEYCRGAYNRSDWIGRFNLTMTYRVDSDVHSPYGQLRYISDPDPVNFTAVALKKTRPIAWFVSHCSTQSQRELYVKRLQKYIDVDIYGHCGKKADTRDLLNNKYKFYLSFENSLCIDYVTEKLFKVYNEHVIPIVRGGFDYKKYIPKDTYINTADFIDPQHLAEYLHYLDNNVTEYTEMLERKHRYRWVRASGMCNLCRYLHKKPQMKKYSDIHDWFTMSGHACHSPRDL